MKKWIAAFGILLVLTSAILTNVIPVNADEDIKEITLDSDSLTITGDDIKKGDDYEYKYVDSEYGYILTIKSDKQMTISGNTTVDRIVVNSQNGANLIFSGLSVDASKRGDLAAFDIDASITNMDAVIKVTLENDTDNTLISKLHAGLQKSSGDCTLIIEGDGKLAAIGGDNSAGIGGGNGGDGTNIIIKGGTITATGGTSGAGIGGGNGGSGSNIQIYGGTIKATTLSGGGAGIGGGNGGYGEKIYIYDCGEVSAKGESGGAGIGGGYGGYGNDIQIQKGTLIEATGSSDDYYGGGAGIGGGSNGSGTNITISGGTKITANGGDGSAGIGGGSDINNSGSGNGSGITISGGSVEAKGGNGGAGIGGGGYGSGTNITISGGSVKATSAGFGAGIGGGRGAIGANITISGGDNITANGGFSGGAGIGGGMGSAGSGITISGGTVVTTGDDGAGIGGGSNSSGGEAIEITDGGEVKSFSGITIKGSAKVTATSSYRGAGIGGGGYGAGTNITISGSADVTTKGYGGAGIGGGFGGDGSGITISGGTVKASCETAYNGGYGAGIGGGSNGSGSNIEISGSADVTAFGCPYVEDTSTGTGGGDGGGAGIGGGAGGSGSDIRITGCKEVTAMGGGNGAGIGGGQGGSGSNIKISGGTKITATGYVDGAGIGGGSGGEGSDIKIWGNANVTATGGYRGAGIGGGYGKQGYDITIGDENEIGITNPLVTAISKSGTDGDKGNGAGIGGGGAGNGEDITINSGKVIATSDLGAGIGGGGVTEANASDRGGDGKKITINGGNIEATSNGGGAGIGGGQQGGCGTDITIKGGTVTATSKSNTGNGSGAGIGGGSSNIGYGFIGNGEKILIEGGNIIATGTGGSAGIGGGGAGNGTEITIRGNAVVTATGAVLENEWGGTSGGGAGIGGGNNGGSGIGITISDNAKVTATSLAGGANIGGGSNGLGTNITISDNADVTVDNRGCQVCIGGWSNEDSVIKITGGTVKTTTNTKTPMLGIGSLGQVDITISGDANVDVAGSIAIGSMKGLGSVKIDGAKEVTATGNNAGINCNNITINGNNDTKVTATCNANFGVGIGSATDSENCTVIITGGTVRATNTDGGTGIGGTGSTVDIRGTSSTAYPWVFTNKITSDNGNDDYFGIVFDENHKKDYVADTPDEGESCNSDNPKKVYGADGVVYGNDNGREDGLVVLNKEYALESGKVLRVQDGAAFKIPEVGVLTLEAGSILYIEKGANLDKYDKITYEGEGNNKGKVLHEAKSKYEDVTDEDGKTKKLCTLCGSETNHTWKTDWVYSKLHHWHDCEDDTDCSIHEYKIDLCSITENEDKYGYGEHSFVKTRSNNIVTFTCRQCGYSYSVEIPEISIYKVDSDDDPLPGAKFRLYSNADCTEQVGEEVTAAERTVDGKTKAAAVFTTYIDLDTLYYIKETEAPDGYIKSNKVYTVKVTAETDESDESDEPIEPPYEPQTIDGKAAYGVVDSEGNVTELNDIPTYVNTKRITPDPIKIIKEDGGEKPLEGAEFSVYSDAACKNLITGTNPTATTAIDTDKASDTYNKAVVSFSTELDTTYYIKETKAPDGYTASEEVYRAVVGKNGKVTYSVVGSASTLEGIPVCENAKIIPDPIKIIKEDGEENPLEGAQFSVFSDEACKNLITSTNPTATTAIDTDKASDTYNKAVVSFSTELDTTYYIKEITPPEGYTASDKVFKAVVGKDGKVTYSVVGSTGTLEGIPVCENYAIKVIVSDPAKIIKVDGETSAPLAGAQFSIYSDENCTKLIKTVTAEIDTDNTSATYNKAVVSFSTEPDSTYYIKETFAPDGYRVSDEVFKAVVNADGKVTYGVVGSETTLAGIPVCENYAVKVIVSEPAKIIKVDRETSAPLTGAQFGIYSDAECTKLITTGITVIDTDNASATYNKAVVSFSTEPNRTYFIKETNAPDGYRVSHEVFKAVVDADGKVTYAAAGSAATSETVPVCKNEKTDEDDDISDLEPDPEDTPPAKAVSPKTGDTAGSGTVGMAILSGIACGVSLVGGVQKRKKKQ